MILTSLFLSQGEPSGLQISEVTEVASPAGNGQAVENVEPIIDLGEASPLPGDCSDHLEPLALLTEASPATTVELCDLIGPITVVCFKSTIA